MSQGSFRYNEWTGKKIKALWSCFIEAQSLIKEWIRRRIVYSVVPRRAPNQTGRCGWLLRARCRCSERARSTLSWDSHTLLAHATPGLGLATSPPSVVLRPASYRTLRAGSESVSYARRRSRKCSVDSARRDGGHTSGWCRSASRRYARLISSAPTSGRCSRDSTL